MASPGNADPEMPDPASPPAPEFDHARAKVILQESDFARPMPKSKRGAAESGARCGSREHRELSSYYRAAEFFARTDPADSRNVESQRGLVQECGLMDRLSST
jgi:hypothetical protein